MKHPIATFLDSNTRTLAANCVGDGGPDCDCAYCACVRTTLMKILRETPPPLSVAIPTWDKPVDDSESTDRAAFNKKNDIRAAHIATVVNEENTRWMVEGLRSKIQGKIVTEIGAGQGFLAVELAKAGAKHVYAIEIDPMFSHLFARKLYLEKPSNLTWIMDKASPEMAKWLPGADVVVVVTGSDESRLRTLAGHFRRRSSRSVVVMPWQDFNGGRAVIARSADGCG